jgi:alkyl hydroperoxide reductase subunit AhpC
MVMFSLREWEFTNRNVKVIALAPGAVSEHRKWCAEMKKTLQTDINIPIAADTARKVSLAYDMSVMCLLCPLRPFLSQLT